MKFFRIFESRLMNEATETDGGGDVGGASEASLGYDYDAANDDSESVITSVSDMAKGLGLDPLKYGFGEEKKNTPEGEDSQGSEGDEENAGQQDVDEKSFIDRLNSLGAIHNELPLKFESADQVKELLQKGHDYTQKTQSLSEERKAFETDRSGAEKELNAAIAEFNTKHEEFGKQLQELQQFKFTLEQLEQNSPDLFEEVQRAHKQTVTQYSNPFVDQRIAALEAQLAKTNKGLVEREDKLIVDGFESEFKAASAYEQSLKELGIAVNKDEVKKKWASTGLSPEEAMSAMYGKLAIQAQASKSKVAQVQAKTTASKPTGTGGKARTGGKIPAIDPGLKGVERAQALLNQLRSA